MVIFFKYFGTILTQNGKKYESQRKKENFSQHRLALPSSLSLSTALTSIMMKGADNLEEAYKYKECTLWVPLLLIDLCSYRRK